MSNENHKSINLLCREYSADLEKYLNSKLPDLPEHTAMEISEYITYKTNNFMADYIREHERVVENRMKRRSRRPVEEKEDENRITPTYVNRWIVTVNPTINSSTAKCPICGALRTIPGTVSVVGASHCDSCGCWINQSSAP